MKARTKRVIVGLSWLGLGACAGGLATFSILYHKPGKNAVWKLQRMIESRLGGPPAAASAEQGTWQLPAGLQLEAHATGFDYPVRIVFANPPPAGPDDPFYYVAELGGSIQVVTRDGRRQPFATGLLNFERKFLDELGLVGLAFDEVGRRFFATMSYWDEAGGVYRNKVERLGCSEDGMRMTDRAVLLDMAQEPTVASYQIQFCAISPDGRLFVGVGSGLRKQDAQDLTRFAGKVLRMNLDGSAPPDNPFYDPADPAAPRSYIYAYGFRNPYDIAWDPRSGVAVVTDVGPGLDRMVRLEKGINYCFANDDNQMRANALYTWGPGGSFAPVGVTFARNEALGPEHAYDLFVGLFGSVHTPGPNLGKRMCRFEIAPTGHLQSHAQDFVQYRGNRFAAVVDVEWGPDGLYFTDLYGESLEPHFGGGVVYRVVPGDSGAAPLPQTEMAVGPERGRFLFYDLRCNTCHTLDGQGGREGPDLTRLRTTLRERLSSAEYVAHLQDLSGRSGAFFVKHRPVYEELQAATGRERVELWIRHHLLDPRFDNPEAKMPSLDLSDADIASLTQFLLD